VELISTNVPGMLLTIVNWARAADEIARPAAAANRIPPPVFLFIMHTPFKYLCFPQRPNTRPSSEGRWAERSSLARRAKVPKGVFLRKNAGDSQMERRVGGATAER